MGELFGDSGLWNQKTFEVDDLYPLPKEIPVVSARPRTSEKHFLSIEFNPMYRWFQRHLLLWKGADKAQINQQWTANMRISLGMKIRALY